MKFLFNIINDNENGGDNNDYFEDHGVEQVDYNDDEDNYDDNDDDDDDNNATLTRLMTVAAAAAN